MKDRRKARSEFWDDTPFVPDLRVYEEESGPIETGLLDAHGNKIVRRAERRSIGFDLTGGKHG